MTNSKKCWQLFLYYIYKLRPNIFNILQLMITLVVYSRHVRY